MQQPSQIWTLTDGHAGNVRQAQALAVALGLPTRAWTLAARRPWRWFSPRRLPGARHAFGPAFADALANDASLEHVIAIGCGRQGALATRLLRARGARAVQILDPRMDPHHWDLVIAPEHDRLHGDNVITLLGSLHPVDDLWLAAARRDFSDWTTLPRPRTAVLLGGPSAHGGFDVRQLDGFLQWLRQQVTDEGGSVLATASRRTPDAVRLRLRTKLEGLPGRGWCGEQDGPNPYAGLLGWADRIIVSADSVNMLSEAAATAVPVYVLGAEQVTGRPRAFLDSLLACGRVRPWSAGLTAFAASPLRETARVALEVRSRLQL